MAIHLKMSTHVTDFGHIKEQDMQLKRPFVSRLCDKVCRVHYEIDHNGL